MARKSHTDEWWASNQDPTRIRCSAHLKSTGERCRTEAHPGTSVCYKHGGAAPQVTAAAATRIAMSAEEIVKRLAGMLDDPNVEPREKVKIMQDWLDRAGLGATSKHLVGVVSDDPVEILYRDLLATPGGLLDPSATPGKALPAPDQRQAELDASEADDGPTWDEWRGDVVDAELVEEPAAVPGGRNPAKPPKHIREALERLL